MRHVLSWKSAAAFIGLLSLTAMFYFSSLSCQINAPKNLQVIKDPDISVEEVKEYMRNFTLGLGVECEYCHNEDDYPSDEKREKRVTRDMMLMMAAINESPILQNESKTVTCYTCHRGTVEINGVPPGL